MEYSLGGYYTTDFLSFSLKFSVASGCVSALSAPFLITLFDPPPGPADLVPEMKHIGHALLLFSPLSCKLQVVK